MDHLQMEKMPRRFGFRSEIRSLYLAAFPREERVPFPILMMCSWAENVDFWLFYEQGTFCGMAYLVRGEKVVSLMYLAVVPSLRTRGIGSQILARLRSRYGGQTIALDIERVENSAGNIRQRRRRKAFYLKNGFFSSGYGHSLRGVDYEILFCGPEFTPEEYAQIMRRYSRGMVRMEIKKLKADTEEAE